MISGRILDLIQRIYKFYDKISSVNTFYIIRHGLKTSQAGNPNLTIDGRIQAEKTAKYLQAKDISKIISSTYKRTLETADIIDQVLHVGIEQDDRLKERMNWGSVQGQTLEEFLKEWEYSDFNRNFNPKAGISSRRASLQVQDMLNEIAQKYPSENIAIITSGPTILDLLRDLADDQELEKMMPGVIRNKLPECSITILQENLGVFTIKELGSVKHLAQSIDKL